MSGFGLLGSDLLQQTFQLLMTHVHELNREYVQTGTLEKPPQSSHVPCDPWDRILNCDGLTEQMNHVPCTCDPWDRILTRDGTNV